MKTKFTTLLLILSFLVASAALADERPKSNANNYNPGYLGPPIEAPRSGTLDIQIKKFFHELFDLPWETVNPEQDFLLETPHRN